MTTRAAWRSEAPTLVGPRVELRPLESRDAASVFAILADADVTRYWSSPPLQSLQAAEELLRDLGEQCGAGRRLQWGIAKRDSRDLIGMCALSNPNLAHRRADVAFVLERGVWGHGFATESLGLLFEHSFGALGLHRIEADVDPDNESSLRVLERHGFKREGYMRERWHHLGRVHDGILLGLLERDWRKGRAGRAVEPGRCT